MKVTEEQFDQLYYDLLAHAGKIELRIQEVELHPSGNYGVFRLGQGAFVRVEDDQVEDYLNGTTKQKREILNDLIAKLQVAHVGPGYDPRR